MVVTEEGISMSDENKKRPDCRNKVMGLFCFGLLWGLATLCFDLKILSGGLRKK
jgi:hypothetical protein